MALLLLTLYLYAHSLPSENLVATIRIDGGITQGTASYVKDAIIYAEKNHASALLIYLDTPGGLLSATREIVQSILVSPVPVIVYVSPEGAHAGSAGLFLMLASSVAVMAPSTNIGASHPVGLMGKDIEGEMKKKIENDTVAWARSLAERHKRNADWAEKAVRQSASISSDEALRLGVIDLIAKNDQEIPGMKGAKLENFPMTIRQKIFSFLSDPNLLYILLLLGLLGIFIEFQGHGLILPGLLGIVSLAIVFGVQILPINWVGALLILAASALFIAEIFITSFGLLAIGGFIFLIAGSYLLFDVPGSELFVQPIIIWVFSGILALIILSLGIFLLRSRHQSYRSNIYALIGAHGTVYERITPDEPGRVELQGSFWLAHADEIIEEAQEVEVIKTEATHVYVKKIKGARE